MKPRSPSSACILLLVFACLLFAGIPAAQVGKPVTVLDANLAPEKDLAAVPHLAPALVKAILDARPFQTMAEFDALLARRSRRAAQGGVRPAVRAPEPEHLHEAKRSC
jgi:hypothetical protein